MQTYEYKERKERVEKCLENYPYYKIVVEECYLKSGKGYGEPSTSKTYKIVDTIGDEVARNEYKAKVVKAIDRVLEKLDENSKKIIELTYFEDMYTMKDMLKELFISKNTYYKLRNKALDRFILVLDNLL